MSLLPTTAQLRERFPDWGDAERGAYRRGVARFDDLGYMPEQPEKEHPCFLRGYADALGPDAEYTDWFTMIEEDWAINSRWWEEGTDDADDED